MLYADGEADQANILRIETHLIACKKCRDELDLVRAMRASVRRSVTKPAPGGLEEKLRAALANVDAADATSLGASSDGRWVSGVKAARGVEARLAEKPERSRQWAAAAMAMAACFVLVVVVLQVEREESPVARMATIATTLPLVSAMPPVAANENDQPSFDALLDKLVALHADPLPPEEKNPEHLTRLEPYVGVPVKRPALTMLRDFGVERGASFDGARLHPLRDSRSCAALHYKMQGHRVTVYMFDPRVIQVARTRLTQRMVRENPVYVGKLRGFSVAAAEKKGVGYALASDLDEDKSLQMVASF
jgi:anti-sigma factor RsiW